MFIGVYVVAKVEYGLGEIVQVVICHIPEQKINEHKELIVEIGEPLLKWMYSEELMSRKHLIINDLPKWMRKEKKEKNYVNIKIVVGLIPQNRKWWWEHNNATTATYYEACCTRCVKLSETMSYANKATELEQLILLTGLTLSFETKYILRMIDGVTCNAWRLFQGVSVCVPYIKAEESAGMSIEI